MRRQAIRPSPGSPGLLVRLAIAGTLAAALLFGLALSPVRANTLKVVGGFKARTVPLEACMTRSGVAGTPGLPARRVCAKGNLNSQPYIGGQVTLLVRNTSGKGGRLRLSYVAAGSSTAIALPGSSARVFLTGEGRRSNRFFNGLLKDGLPVVSRASLRRMFRSVARKAARSTLRFGKNEVRPVSVGFVLAPGEAVKSIDGVLILRMGRGSAMVPVKGEARGFKGVAVQPESLEMGWGEEATVVLSGTEVLDFLRSGGFGSERVSTLRSDSGDTAKASTELPTARTVAAQENPNRVELTVTLPGDQPPPGKYTGQLALSNFSAAAPAVEIEVTSRRSLLVLIGLAFAGVLVAGLGRRLWAFAVRRRLLLEMLGQSKAAYDHVRAIDTEDSSWDLGDLLGTPQGNSSSDEYRLQGVEGLRDSIEMARAKRDLDEDTERVLDMVARIQRWLRIEPAVWRLAKVAAFVPEGEVDGRTWLETNIWRDAQLLLELAQREPKDVAAADDLVCRLLRQAEWHHEFAMIWGIAARTTGFKTKVAQLDRALGKAPTARCRTLEEQDALDGQLQILVEQVRERGETIDEIPGLDREPSEEFGVTKVDWNASPNLFTGWATLDGASYGQLARRAARGARRLGWQDIKMEWKASGPSDIGWSLVALGFASLVYGSAAYDETWGSREDMLAAFIAGATGAVVVNWAALPLFQSIRTRAAEKKEKKKAAQVKQKASPVTQGAS